MKRHPLLLLLLVCFSACETIDRSGPSAGSTAGGGASLRTVAGTWRFSHFGLPTVSNEDLSDPAKIAKDYLKDTKISLKENGEGAMIFSGQAGAFRAKIIEETELYIKIGVDGQEAADAFVYDRKSRFLMMPMKLELQGSGGILPTYFKRERGGR